MSDAGTPRPPGDVLHKYLSATGAIATLTNLKTRWSSPLSFNDPFDPFDSIGFGFELDELVPIIASRMRGLMENDEPIPSGAVASIKAIAEQGRAYRREGTLEKNLRSPLAAAKAGVENARQSVIRINQRWELMVRSMRIFCVSETFDDLLMWAHYAEMHRGAVLRFRYFPDRKDATLREVAPVSYQKTIPVIAVSAEAWADELFGTIPGDGGALLDRLVLTKSDHWKYEREWRCLGGDPMAQSGEQFDHWDFSPDEVSAIYLGCRMLTEHQQAILTLARDKLPHAPVFRARRTPGMFGLTFDPV